MAKKQFSKANDNVASIHIFLDMDGVISDFDTHARTQGKLKSNGKLDYDALDFKWWSTMPVFAGAREFYNDLNKLGPVRFLTGPMLSPDCHGGKADWIINKFLPDRGKRGLNELIICPSSDKQLLAGANRILIDDREENICAWVAAGGIGIHHTGDFNATLAKVKQAILNSQSASRTQPKPGLN